MNKQAKIAIVTSVILFAIFIFVFPVRIFMTAYILATLPFLLRNNETQPNPDADASEKEIKSLKKQMAKQIQQARTESFLSGIAQALAANEETVARNKKNLVFDVIEKDGKVIGLNLGIEHIHGKDVMFYPMYVTKNNQVENLYVKRRTLEEKEPEESPPEYLPEEYIQYEEYPNASIR